jgi:hypothetical protein
MKKDKSDYPPFWGLFASSIAVFNALRNVVPLAVKCPRYQQLNFEIHEMQEALLPWRKPEEKAAYRNLGCGTY